MDFDQAVRLAILLTAESCARIAEEVRDEFPKGNFSNSDWKKGSGAAHVAYRIRQEIETYLKEAK